MTLVISLVAILKVINKLCDPTVKISEIIIRISHRRYRSSNDQQASQYQKHCNPSKILVCVARIGTPTTFRRTVVLAATAAQKARRHQNEQNESNHKGADEYECPDSIDL